MHGMSIDTLMMLCAFQLTQDVAVTEMLYFIVLYRL